MLAPRPGLTGPDGSFCCLPRHPLYAPCRFICTYYLRVVRAITVVPGQQGSAALADMPEPPLDDGPILVETEAVGVYTERGIKDRHGYASDRCRIHSQYLVKVDSALATLGVLLEPATVVAKAGS